MQMKHSSLDLNLTPMEDKGLFLEEIQKVRYYAEWGLGSSTRIASSLGLSGIIAIDSSPVWVEKLREQIDDINVFWVHHNVGPTKKLGRPKRAFRNFWRFPGFSLALERAMKKVGWKPQLVLVDGRFRTSCFVRAYLSCNPGTVILFDDYSNRAHQSVEKVIKPEEIRDQVAKFVVPQKRHRAAALRLWLIHCWIPD